MSVQVFSLDYNSHQREKLEKAIRAARDRFRGCYIYAAFTREHERDLARFEIETDKYELGEIAFFIGYFYRSEAGQ